MRKCLSIFFVLLIAAGSQLSAASNTFLDYQNYNHGYCPDCNCCPCKCAGGGCYAPQPPPPPPSPNQPPPPPPPPGDPQDPINPQGACKKPEPCCPPATSTCTECGLNIVYVGLGIAAVVTAATILIGMDNGSVHSHSSP